jgi:hypothetical protein
MKAAAGRQKLPGRLEVARTNRQACRQPAGRQKAGGSQVGAGSRHAVRQGARQAVPGRQADEIRQRGKFW